MKKIIAFVLIASTFTACIRKTDEDPMLSFRSRKDRVIGEWHPKTGSIVITQGIYQEAYNITGNTFNYSNPVSYWVGTASIQFKFERNGNCSITINMGGFISETKGLWNLTEGIGDTKNKTKIVVQPQTFYDGGGTITYSGNTYELTYDITELTNKEMKLHLQYARTDAAGQFFEYDESWTLVPL